MEQILSRQQLAAQEVLKLLKARSSLLEFTCYTDPHYQPAWFHRTIAGVIDDWIKGDIKRLMIETAPQHGKLLAHDTPILTPNGWTTHGELKAGDSVFGRDGKPVRVLAISVDGVANREVEFTDSSVIRCHGRHEWVVRLNERELTVETDWIMNAGVWRGSRGRRARGKFQIDSMRAIRDIRECEPVAGRCIQVEGGIYLAGEKLIPTHNSRLASVETPALLYGLNPDEIIAAASYSSGLAKRNNRNVQRAMKRLAYRRLFPNTRLNDSNIVTQVGKPLLNSDVFEIVDKESVIRGSYRSTGVMGALSGHGFRRGIVDDPVKDRLEADSQVRRDNVWEWYSSVFVTRQAPDASQMVMSTRWHADDLCGRILVTEGNKWERLTLPGLSEDLTLKYEERKEIDIPLWPERYPFEFYDEHRRRSPYNFSALYQQNPTPRTGGFIKVDKIRDNANFAKDQYWPRVRFWDLGGSNSKKADRTSGTRMRRQGNEFIIEDLKAGQWSPAERNQIMLQTAKDDLELNVITVVEWVPGIAVEVLKNIVDLFTAAGLTIETRKPNGGKETRAEPFAVAVENGLVSLCAGDWNRELRGEMQGFPYAAHDDIVDSTAGAFNELYVGVEYEEPDFEQTSWAEWAM
jgi:predicted phage terminase large subunit-like protein